uniref:Amino acid transporter transmembrane domain-containing protein n=1 Tax=Ditylenchus dipsaci TaxID=166011 RepID=A0A915DV16_9BILA
MMLFVSTALLPVTMLKSPQDFWWAVVTAMITTAISVMLILIGTWLDYEYCAPVAEYPAYQFDHLLLSLGIFMFSFGGHSVFPTIQHDMKHPQHFTKSSILAFVVVFIMYIPITVLGYMVYGDSLKDSIIMSIQSSYIQQAANLFIAVHCILTLTIVINPLNQEIEHMLKIPHHFGWKRILLRSSTLLAIVFSAETVPSFGPILNLIGGTTVAFTSAIMPCLFYLYLHAQEKRVNEKIRKGVHSKHRIPTFNQILERTPPLVLGINIFVIVVAVICGIATTQSAVVELATSSFSVPCYLSSSSPNNQDSVSHAVHCCGHHQNVSRYGSSSFCPAIS